jgi:hypothetical protein
MSMCGEFALRVCDSFICVEIWKLWGSVDLLNLGLRWCKKAEKPLLTVCCWRSSYEPVSLPSITVASLLYTLWLRCTGLVWEVSTWVSAWVSSWVCPWVSPCFLARGPYEDSFHRGAQGRPTLVPICIMSCPFYHFSSAMYCFILHCMHNELEKLLY